MNSKRRILWRLLVDVPLFSFVVIVYGLFEMAVIPNHKSGFYCKDPALSFKYRGNTVSSAVLVSTLLFLVPVVVFPTELILEQHSLSSFRTRSMNALRRTYSISRMFYFGLIANLLVVSMLKGLMGMPRPVFFDLCKPDTAATCQENEFVKTFECTSSHSTLRKIDSYRSFPSGHTALSVYAGFFIVWYLQVRAFNWRNRAMFVVPFAQILAVSYSVVCSVTRITDRVHHWWDVLAGFVIGVIFTFYTVRILMRNFKGHSLSSASSSSSDSSELLNRQIIQDVP